MGSKAILLLCLLAAVLMIASEVTARDLAENSKLSFFFLKWPKIGSYPFKNLLFPLSTILYLQNIDVFAQHEFLKTVFFL